jgi:hypothetical protein
MNSHKHDGNTNEASNGYVVFKGRWSRKMKWVEKESVIDFLPGTVAFEGYLQFEHVVFV